MARYLRAPGLNKGGNLDDQENFDKLGTDFGFGYNQEQQYEHSADAPTNGDHNGLASLFSGSNGGDTNNDNGSAILRRDSQETLNQLATLTTANKNKGDKDQMSVSSYGDDVSQPLSSKNGHESINDDDKSRR
eukprot:44359_1